MLERQVEKQALEAIERGIATCIDDGDRRRERVAVAGEGARRIAEGVARELVEQHDVRERVVDVVIGDVRRAGERGVERMPEKRADRRIEGRDPS